MAFCGSGRLNMVLKVKQKKSEVWLIPFIETIIIPCVLRLAIVRHSLMEMIVYSNDLFSGSSAVSTNRDSGESFLTTFMKKVGLK